MRPRLLSGALAALMLLGVAPAGACEGGPIVREASARDIARFVRQQQRRVLSFVGYSGAGYEDSQALRDIAGAVLDAHDPATTIVNIGATAEGIGVVYELARARGFTTMGIVSSLARDEAVALSPCVDHVFFVPDGAWGGMLPGGKKLSPTSAAIVANSREIVGIGGGDIARDEMRAALRAGRRVSFFAADMNHRIAIDKARAKGQPDPDDFRGSAHAVFAAR